MNWEIRDETGCIRSGTADEMDTAWDILTFDGDVTDYVEHQIKLCKEDTPDNRTAFMDLYLKWYDDWEGDLELVEVHKIHRS